MTLDEALRFYPPNQVLANDDGSAVLVCALSDGGDYLEYRLVTHEGFNRRKFVREHADPDYVKGYLSAWLMEAYGIDLETLHGAPWLG